MGMEAAMTDKKEQPKPLQKVQDIDAGKAVAWKDGEGSVKD
jgi:hypothetical protein